MNFSNRLFCWTGGIEREDLLLEGAGFLPLDVDLLVVEAFL